MRIEHHYCKDCYRDVGPEETRCRQCAQRNAEPLSRLTLVFGVAGLPILIAGMLTYNTRVCLAGAAISGVAALFHVALSLR
jgi:hypothetical protein